jgi:hypothetical protein
VGAEGPVFGGTAGVLIWRSPAMSADLWTDSFLDSMRAVGDPPADAVVAELFAGGTSLVRAVNDVMRDLVENDDVPAPTLPQHVREYFLASPLPPWADPARLAAGTALFHRYGPLMIMLLNTCSLPLCYAGWRGVQVLARTDRLHSNPRRRVVETAQLIIDAMAPGGLDPGSNGAGLRSAQKVRLMHATIRHLLAADHDWDPDFGLPVNQEDMAGTLMTFSVAVLDGLAHLDVVLTADEVEAYMHTWNVIGHVMGLRDELLPADHASGKLLAARVAERQFAASPEGQRMMRALLDMMRELVPGTAFDHVPAQFVRYFLGPAVAEMLEVPTDDGESRLVRVWRTLGRVGDEVGDNSAAIRGLARRFSGLMIEGLLVANRGPKRLAFRIPTETRQVWGENWT